jgi:hypothetical protein
MSNTETGRLTLIKPTQVVSEKFSKREFVITTSDNYPQQILFQCTQDKCALLDGIAEGTDVTVHYNLRGREWQSPSGEIKYFNTLEAWRIEPLTVTKAEPQAQGTIDDFPHF